MRRRFALALLPATHSFCLAVFIAPLLLLTVAHAAPRPSPACAEFSSSYLQQLKILQLPAAAAEATALHAAGECERAADSLHFFTRCCSLLYRWCSGGGGGGGVGAGNATARRCGADWQRVAGLHRVDSLQSLLQHARRYQQRLLQASGSSGPARSLIYR